MDRLFTQYRQTYVTIIEVRLALIEVVKELLAHVKVKWSLHPLPRVTPGLGLGLGTAEPGAERDANITAHVGV